MTFFATLFTALFGRVERLGDWALPMIARFIIAATLLIYYWNSGLTKLGDGLFGVFNPSVGAYMQIFPKQLEAVGYDTSQLTGLHWLVVVCGTGAEFVLPVLIVLGLMTRFAAFGMIVFVVMQSLTDVFGHGLTDARTLGAWFDRFPDSVILDQRLFWVFTLMFLVVRGAGVVSLDTLVRRYLAPHAG
jgi:putative oxidoreductase